MRTIKKNNEKTMKIMWRWNLTRAAKKQQNWQKRKTISHNEKRIYDIIFGIYSKKHTMNYLRIDFFTFFSFFLFRFLSICSHGVKNINVIVELAALTNNGNEMQRHGKTIVILSFQINERKSPPWFILMLYLLNQCVNKREEYYLVTRRGRQKARQE